MRVGRAVAGRLIWKGHLPFLLHQFMIQLPAVDDVIMCHSVHVSMCPTHDGHDSRQGGSMAVGLERSPALFCSTLI
jgi:hypothetical protein